MTVRSSSVSLSALACVLLLSTAGPALSQPVGEFHVNTQTDLSQAHPKVARRYGTPGFVVVWDGHGTGAVVTDIFGAVFDAQASKVVADFRVNGYQTGVQTYPAVAGQYDGTFTVVWESIQFEANYGIYGRRLDAGANAVGTDFLVSSYNTSEQRHPSVSPAHDPPLTRIAWEGAGPGDGQGAFQAYGTLAGEYLVNTYTPGNQKSVAVSGNIALSPGTPDYLVVWCGNNATEGNFGIGGRLYDSAGVPLTSEFRVNGDTRATTSPAVAADSFSPGFVVVWEVATIAGGKDIHARRLDANGSPRGPEFRVNTYTTGQQTQPQVAADGNGNFVVVWSHYPGGGNADVYAQAFSAAGVPMGPEFRVNTYTTNQQRFPSIATTGAGAARFVIVWQSFGQEGIVTGSDGVFGSLFTVPFPTGDTNGDGTVNVSDVFYLINNLFAGGTDPVGNGDVNGDHVVDVNDVFYLINYLFAGGPAPV